jgi:hypothetical protein
MSEKKTIQINPELFSFQNTTRKKRSSSTTPKEIKVKDDSVNTKNNKTTKGRILRYIREQQEKNYKELFNENHSFSSYPPKKETSATKQPPPSIHSGSSDFENSVSFLKHLTEQEEQKKHQQSLNQTIKRHPNYSEYYMSQMQHPSVSGQINTSIPSQDISEILSKPYSDVIQSIVPPTNSTPGIQLRSNVPNYPAPVYGCLKNGNLPTYRTMMQQTRKNIGMPKIQITSTGNSSDILSSSSSSYPGPSVSSSSPTSSLLGSSIKNPVSFSSSITENNQSNRIEELKRLSEIRQLQEKRALSKGGSFHNNLKYMKRKKTVRRTYKVGKSKIVPRVSVLISNRTIRKEISTKAQLLKQIPIQDVRKYLTKNGFIKVGSTAPNDVLRKMYETAVMIGGEVNNHNPENLLYNFLNDQEK